MKIKKVCVVIFKIILIVFLVILLNLVFMPKYINENMDGRIVSEYYRQKYDPDVLFFGSSTVYSGISPVYMYEKYGFTSYVMATSSQTSWLSYDLLRESLKYHKPKAVVLDIGFIKEADDYAEEVSNRKAFDYMRPGKIKYDGLMDSMADVESIWDYVLPIFRYHSRWNDLGIDDFKYALYKPEVTYNGFIMNKNFSTDELIHKSADEIADYTIGNRNELYVAQFVNLCKDNNIELLFVKVPSFDDKWKENMESDLNKVADAFNIEYINYDRADIDFDWNQDSPDNGGHLNLYGAEKFSERLGKDLIDRFDLIDTESNDTLKEKWNSKVVRYENDKKNK